MRIGYGEDIHRIVEKGRPLIICATPISEDIQIDAHSDGDCALHALCDSLLGAIGEKDIGYFFKTSDPKWEGAPSSLMVEEVRKMVDEKGYKISNVDISIMLEKPHLSPFREKMVDKIANLLIIDKSQISIKFGTNEKMDAVGQGLAIRSVAVVLLEEK